MPKIDLSQTKYTKEWAIKKYLSRPMSSAWRFAQHVIKWVTAILAALYTVIILPTSTPNPFIFAVVIYGTVSLDLFAWAVWAIITENLSLDDVARVIRNKAGVVNDI